MPLYIIFLIELLGVPINGSYGGGPQLVNITYDGDTMIAIKVTGDDTVPRGEVTFNANLSPPPLKSAATVDSDSESSLEETSESLSSGEEHTVLESKYGESIFPGQGHISKKNFKDSKFINGVFIIYDTHRFSFSWVPTKHHVFFVRPSPNETIRLMRDVISKEDEIENQRHHLARCFDMDMTTSQQQRNTADEDDLEEENEDTFRRIKSHSDLQLWRAAMKNNDIVGESTGHSIFKFWRANKWRKIIDNVLGQDGTQ